MDNIPTGKTYLNPISILEKVGLEPSQKVADFGCGGSGYFALQAAKMIGSKGLVYAVDILKPALSAILSKARLMSLSNIRTVWTDLEKFGAAKSIKNNSLDFGLLKNILYQSKKQLEILKETARTLKKEGKLLVIDWEVTGLGFGPKKENLVSKENVIKMAASCGLAEMESFKAGPYHWGLIFVKSG
jgi:ubiquinone/menaquinone biosynthesis C-methylase UbiE